MHKILTKTPTQNTCDNNNGKNKEIENGRKDETYSNFNTRIAPLLTHIKFRVLRFILPRQVSFYYFLLVIFSLPFLS